MIDLNNFLGLVLILLYFLFCCNNFYYAQNKNYYELNTGGYSQCTWIGSVSSFSIPSDVDNCMIVSLGASYNYGGGVGFANISTSAGTLTTLSQKVFYTYYVDKTVNIGASVMTCQLKGGKGATITCSQSIYTKVFYYLLLY